MNITPYLYFNGKAEAAASFYADALGGNIENLYRHSQTPPADGMPPVGGADANLVMHCVIGFPGGTLSVADTLPGAPRDFGSGGHMLTLSCDSAAQAEAAWAKLTAGAKKIVCPLCETFYAKLYGDVVDRFGVMWAVMYEGA